MANDELSQKISMLYRQVEDLRTRSLSDPGSASEILNGAMGELRVGLEELSAAEVKLCQQNEELLVVAEENGKLLTALQEERDRLSVLVDSSALRISRGVKQVSACRFKRDTSRRL